MGKRELIALLCSSSWCLVIVVWLFLGVPSACLQFVILVFPDHTHYFCTVKTWPSAGRGWFLFNTSVGNISSLVRSKNNFSGMFTR